MPKIKITTEELKDYNKIYIVDINYKPKRSRVKRMPLLDMCIYHNSVIAYGNEKLCMTIGVPLNKDVLASIESILFAEYELVGKSIKTDNKKYYLTPFDMKVLDSKLRHSPALLQYLKDIIKTHT